ncbi:MAG TPA: type II secretion system protein [Sedimentisphaerales bacterium]|nr:type II secretion system protein [Sedimentisphaerales bacterium]
MKIESMTMKRSAFTFVEVLVAILLVGLAVASLVAANISFTKVNAAGADVSTAEFLLEQIRERSALTAFDDLTSQTFSPPVNVDGEVLTDFTSYSQEVVVENVEPSNLEVPAGSATDFLRVTVKVYLNSRELDSAAWIRTRY